MFYLYILGCSISLVSKWAFFKHSISTENNETARLTPIDAFTFISDVCIFKNITIFVIQIGIFYDTILLLSHAIEAKTHCIFIDSLYVRYAFRVTHSDYLTRTSSLRN